MDKHNQGVGFDTSISKKIRLLGALHQYSCPRKCPPVLRLQFHHDGNPIIPNKQGQKIRVENQSIMRKQQAGEDYTTEYNS